MLSCSICLSFEIYVWLLFKFLLDGIFLCSCCLFLGFCASNFPKILWLVFSTLVLLVLREMWLLYFTLFAPDTAFAYDFLNAVDSLVGFSVSSLAVSGLHFSLLNFLNLRLCKRHWSWWFVESESIHLLWLHFSDQYEFNWYSVWCAQ